jgi:hypothetical protein
LHSVQKSVSLLKVKKHLSIKKHFKIRAMNTENTISKAKNILIVLPHQEAKTKVLHELMAHFCGTVVKSVSEIQGDLSQKRIYVCGDIDQLQKDGTPF